MLVKFEGQGLQKGDVVSQYFLITEVQFQHN